MHINCQHVVCLFVCLFGVKNAGGATTSQIISDEIRNEGAYRLN